MKGCPAINALQIFCLIFFVIVQLVARSYVTDVAVVEEWVGVVVTSVDQGYTYPHHMVQRGGGSYLSSKDITEC